MRKIVVAFFCFWAMLTGILSAQVSPTAAARTHLDATLAPFYHGVASGDPLSDRVIIWTRVTYDTTGPVTVNWTVALDTNMAQVVTSGTATTDSLQDYTVKVDVTGLTADTWYYYRFDYIGRNSLVGRTRTMPASGGDSLRFGVASCANYQSGFFNSYRALADRNDIDLVIHVGDYIYEYEVGGYGYTAGISRDHEPSTEIISLDDYRLRYSQYRLDDDLRFAHQQYPFVSTWDDHESADNSWRDGAENHNTGEGTWPDRKAASIQAYHEWMPVRQPDQNDPERIWRTVRYGDLADFVVLDTRLYDRDEQVAATSGSLNDTSRTLLGKSQYNWLTGELRDTTTQWKIVGNQTMMAPLTVLGTPFNTDQWDGYPAERSKLFDFMEQQGIENTVVVTGDIHTSWANDLPGSNYNSSTGAGSVGVEFICPSVTSPNGSIPVGTGIIQLVNPHIKYIDLANHGYFVVGVNRQRTQADWYFVDINQAGLGATYDDSWQTLDGTQYLSNASGPLPAHTLPVPFAPRTSGNPPLVGIGSGNPDEMVFFGMSPNPTYGDLIVQYYLPGASKLKLSLMDLNGKVHWEGQREHATGGLHYVQLDLASLAGGTYLLNVAYANQVVVKKVVLLK